MRIELHCPRCGGANLKMVSGIKRRLAGIETHKTQCRCVECRKLFTSKIEIESRTDRSHLKPYLVIRVFGSGADEIADHMKKEASYVH